MAKKELSEAEMVNLVRNALLVAGHEMGAEGDHWPVIKSTVYSVMREWEDIQAERNAFVELKKYVDDVIQEMESAKADCPDELLPELTELTNELRDVADACFTGVDQTKLVLSDIEIPDYLMRAQTIIKTLESNDDRN